METSIIQALRNLIQEAIAEVMTEDACTSGAVGGAYNPVLMMNTNHQATTVVNVDGHNKNRKRVSPKPVKKKEVEKLLGQSFKGENWLNPRLNDKITKPTKQDKKVRKEAKGELLKEGNGNAPFDSNVIYNVGKTQVNVIYNKILLPYFTFFSLLFSKKLNPSRLKLLNAYSVIGAIISNERAVNSRNFDPKLLKLYTNLTSCHGHIHTVLGNSVDELNLTPIGEDEQLESVTSRILNNVNIIKVMIDAVLSPIENGYVAALQQFNHPAIIQSDVYKQMTQIVNESVGVLTSGQREVLKSNYEKHSKIYYGSNMVNKMHSFIAGFNIHTFPVPMGNVVKPSLNSTSPAMQPMLEALGQSFEKLCEIFRGYDRELETINHSIDFKNFIKDGKINTRTLRRELRINSYGFFGLKFEQVISKVQEELGKYAEVTSRKPILDPIKEYIGKMGLETLTPSQEEFTQLALTCIDTREEGHNFFSVEEIAGEKDPRKIGEVISAGLGFSQFEGSMLDLIQDWLSATMWPELVLLKAGKLEFGEVINLIRERSVHSRTDEPHAPEALVKVLGRTEFYVTQNDHLMEWNASNAYKALMERLLVWRFIEGLVKMPEDFWQSLILTPAFYRSKVLSATAEEKQGPDYNPDEVGEDDIDYAERQLHAKAGDEKFNSNQFAKILQSMISKYDFGEKTSTALNIQSYHDLLKRYAGFRIKGKTPDEVNLVGQVLWKLLTGFMDTYGHRFEANTRTYSDKEKAKFLTKLFEINLASPEFDRTKFENDILYVIKFFNPTNLQNLATGNAIPGKNVNVGANTQVAESVGKVLEYIKMLLKE